MIKLTDDEIEVLTGGISMNAPLARWRIARAIEAEVLRLNEQEIATLRERLEFAHAVLKEEQARGISDGDKLLQQSKEIEALRKDAARIDHVESHGGGGLGLSKTRDGSWWAMPHKKLSAARFPDLRSAIDSTMQTKEAS